MMRTSLKHLKRTSDSRRSALVRDMRGFSRVELICGAGIVLAIIAVLIALGAFMLDNMQRGDDSVTLHTAKTCGSVNATGACLVPDCPGMDTPVHQLSHIDSDGYNFAYFDKVGNCLTGERSEGYNEATVTDLDNKSYAPGSAVVRVENHDGTIVCGWVLGK